MVAFRKVRKKRQPMAHVIRPHRQNWTNCCKRCNLNSRRSKQEITIAFGTSRRPLGWRHFVCISVTWHTAENAGDKCLTENVFVFGIGSKVGRRATQVNLRQCRNKLAREHNATINFYWATNSQSFWILNDMQRDKGIVNDGQKMNILRARDKHTATSETSYLVIWSPLSVQWNLVRIHTNRWRMLWRTMTNDNFHQENKNQIETREWNTLIRQSISVVTDGRCIAINQSANKGLWQNNCTFFAHMLLRLTLWKHKRNICGSVRINSKCHIVCRPCQWCRTLFNFRNCCRTWKYSSCDFHGAMAGRNDDDGCTSAFHVCRCTLSVVAVDLRQFGQIECLRF